MALLRLIIVTLGFAVIAILSHPGLAWAEVHDCEEDGGFSDYICTSDWSECPGGEDEHLACAARFLPETTNCTVAEYQCGPHTCGGGTQISFPAPSDLAAATAETVGQR